MPVKKLPPEFAWSEQPDGKPVERRPLTRRDFVKIASAVAGAAVASGVGAPSIVSAAKKTKYDTPTLSCFSATDHTLTIQLCAGASGAPAGFSIQWMTCDALDAYVGTLDNNGWPVDDSVFCKASFSGNANLSNWNLGPSECATVVIGGLNDADPGVSFTCNDPLECETCYVFRAFAHATRTLNRSEFTTHLQCTTNACDEVCGEPVEDGDFCTHGKGFFGGGGSLDAEATCFNADGGTGETPVTAGSGTILTLGGGTYSYVWQLTQTYTDVEGGPNEHWVDNGLLALRNAITGGGASGFFTADGLNTTGMGAGGALATQAAALTLNLTDCFGATDYGDVFLCGFEAGDTFQNDGTPISAGTAAALNGQTINDVLVATNAYLGGNGAVAVPYLLPNGAALNELLAALNDAFALTDCDATTFALAHLMHDSCVECD